MSMDTRQEQALIREIRRRDDRIEELLQHIQKLEEALELIEGQTSVTTDRVTGLYHHAHFQSLFSREFVESKRYNRPISVLLIDLDGFREINSAYGHAQGDRVLQNVAKALQGCCRETDIIGRYGGEEFVVALPQTDLAGAHFTSERIRHAIAELSISDDAGNAIRQVTVTIGYETRRPGDHNSFALLDRTHRALRSAKVEGRNRCGRAGDSLSIEEEHAQVSAYRDVFLNAMRALSHGRDNEISLWASELGKALGLDLSECEALSLAAALYDIGKVGVPEGILSKTEELDTEEWRLLMAHAACGNRLLKSGGYDSLAEAVLYHHERWDGKGYPDGLKGEEIPFASRILAVLDAYQAMTSERPYRKALTPAEAKIRLHDAAGTQFDPKVVNAFLHLDTI